MPVSMKPVDAGLASISGLTKRRRRHTGIINVNHVLRHKTGLQHACNTSNNQSHTDRPSRISPWIKAMNIVIRALRPRFIQRRNVNIASPNDPIIHNHARSNGCDETDVRAEEGQERGSGVDDFPGHDQDCEDGAEDLTSSNCEVFREKTGQIAANWNGVRGDVGHHGGVDLCEGADEDEASSGGTPVAGEDGSVKVPNIPVGDTEHFVAGSGDKNADNDDHWLGEKEADGERIDI